MKRFIAALIVSCLWLTGAHAQFNKFSRCTLEGFCSGGNGVISVLPISNVVGWWDAKVTASFNLTGANINSIADQSGLSNTMSKVGSSNFPQYNATGFNGTYPSVVFSATDLCALEAASFPMGTGNTLTFWYVGTLSGFAAQNFARYFSYATPGVHDDWNYVGSWSVNNVSPANSGTIQFQRNTTLVAATGISASPAGHRVIGTINSSGTLTLYVDGISIGTVATGGGNWVTSGTVGWGRNGFGSFNYNTIVTGELGISTDFSNSTTVANLDNYLKNKWGL